jgi:hypothetical protein
MPGIKQEKMGTDGQENSTGLTADSLGIEYYDVLKS